MALRDALSEEKLADDQAALIEQMDRFPLSPRHGRSALRGYSILRTPTLAICASTTMTAAFGIF